MNKEKRNQIINRIKEYSFSDFMLKSAEVTYNAILEHKKFTNSYRFINRSSGADNLLLVLAGFQPYFWEVLLGRVKKIVDNSANRIDVCVCVPGVDNDGTLMRLSETYGWSYLKIKHDLLAQVQNVAIKLHDKAKYIFKIDEDIVLPVGFFDNMLKAYDEAKKTFYTGIGFLGPCININAYTVTPFLKGINKFTEFEDRFGQYTLSPFWHAAKIHNDPQTATWIWSNSLPFDDVAMTISRNNKNKMSLCPHRFSIGAFLISREVWETMGGYVVGCNATMGLEEYELSNFCSKNMMGIAIAEDIFVGHLGFSIQKGPVRDLFEKNKESFLIK